MENIPFRIIPLGGLGEIGRNMMVYEYADQYLIVDAGLLFPDSDMPGVDYIIPDFQFLKDKVDKVVGIVITHGHEDHIGAVHHLLDLVQAPVYATPLTRGLLEVKLGRAGVLSRTSLITVQAGERVEIGPFKVDFFHVCHSIPDSVGLGIETPAGLVVHSGDYKFDHTPVDNWPTDYARLAEFSRRGVAVLMADSTNSEHPGWTPSERVIDQALDQVFNQAKGRIILASFASLVSRMQQVANAAVKHNRKLAFVGTSMVDNAKMARKLGYLDVPETLVIPIDQALGLPADQVTIMCTGSQGEPSSILGRLSTGTYRSFSIQEGDTVILSSKAIPGNEEAVYRTINRLFERGANVIYEDIAPVHVSGHASQEEIKLLINLVRPKYLIPIHGEMRHRRQHANLAREMGIPAENIMIVDNGQVIELLDGTLYEGDRVCTSQVFVDGSKVGDVSADVMREREMLARSGVVLVHLVVDKNTHVLRADPEIISRGFILGNEGDQLFSLVRIKINDAVRQSNGNGTVEEDVERALRGFLFDETRRRPMVFVTASRV
ncbi:MAG: ribonuclease J [Anaerolineae bacterium]|nr:ribonuclease J [Anaerolineae bacterium]